MFTLKEITALHLAKYFKYFGLFQEIKLNTIIYAYTRKHLTISNTKFA